MIDVVSVDGLNWLKCDSGLGYLPMTTPDVSYVLQASSANIAAGIEATLPVCGVDRG